MPSIDQKTALKIRTMIAEGKPVHEIARACYVGRSTVYNYGGSMSVPTATLRDILNKAGVTDRQVAAAMGWHIPDVSRARRTLGKVPHSATNAPQQHVHRRVAEDILRALEIDPCVLNVVAVTLLHGQTGPDDEMEEAA